MKATLVSFAVLQSPSAKTPIVDARAAPYLSHPTRRWGANQTSRTTAVPAPSPTASAPSVRARRRTLANSPNRRREVLRVAVWVLFAGGASVIVPYLVL